MKKVRVSVTASAVLGVFSVLALIFLFLALSDIAHQEEDLSLEWQIAGICMLILSAFTVSVYVTIGLIMKYLIKFRE